ncbi:hypothetical protein ARMSODRAFT_845982, partial [Armillaria solidipes]
ELARFSQTSLRAHYSVFAYIRRACSVCQSISRWFCDVDGFRDLQRATGLLVSGLTALSLFERVRYPGADMDLYVLADHWSPVMEYMIQSGYQPILQSVPQTDDLVSEKSQKWDLCEYRRYEWGTRDAMAYTLPGIKTVVDLVDGVGRKVQVVFVIYNPLDVILGFHSTVVMNFISHSGAFSLFPFSTFVLRRSIVFGFTGTSDQRDEVFEKYGSRGW